MKRGIRTTTLVVFVIAMSIFMLTGCNSNNNNNVVETTNENNNVGTESTEAIEAGQATFEGIANSSVEELSTFDSLEGVKAIGDDGQDVTANIEVTGVVNTLKAGDYELIYTLKDSDLVANRVVTVTAVEAKLANGTYNYRFAPAETRNAIMAAAEDYLLHNQTAGIPLYSDSAYGLFSNRMQLKSETPMPVMDYGISLSSFAVDDSKVLMENGESGIEGQFTYRSSISNNPQTWNPYLQEDGTTSAIISNYVSGLYEFDFNDDKTGYVLAPALAEGDPIAIDGRELPSGGVAANKWRITVRDGLEWKFNDHADTSMITDMTINAVDYYDTYKIAMTNKWFRAVSGGWDFCTANMAVVNGQEYVDGVADWESVGIKLIDENTIEFDFIHEKTLFDVKWLFNSTSKSPINVEQYEALGEEFATGPDTIAYTGAYYVDYYESDKVIRMIKNEKNPDADKYFYTHRTSMIIVDLEMRFQEFLAGKLDYVPLPSPQFENYKNHPGLKRIPGATTTRLNINGSGTTEKQIEQFADSEWVPEPILANTDFKMAMYHSLDRKKLAEEVMKTTTGQMYLFTEAYVVDPATGIPYRNTEAGMTVAQDLSPSTLGYNLDAATAYYEKALDALVEEGVYANGDEITIELYYRVGDEGDALLATYMKNAMEEAFKSEKHNINVKVETEVKDYPGIYYDHLMIGEFDLAIGGIMGSTLDAASFLDIYCSDNRGWWTLNWGNDTSVVELTATYKNTDGKLVKELWSYDALIMALNGETEVVDGGEVVTEDE